MKISYRNAEEQTSKQRKHRVSHVAMERRHCARFNTSFESVAYDQLLTGSQFSYKRIEGAEVIAVV